MSSDEVLTKNPHHSIHSSAYKNFPKNYYGVQENVHTSIPRASFTPIWTKVKLDTASMQHNYVATLSIYNVLVYANGSPICDTLQHYLLFFTMRLPSESTSKLVDVFSTLMWQLYSGTPRSRVVRNSLATSGSLVIRRKSSTKRSSRPLRGLTLGRWFFSMSA